MRAQLNVSCDSDDKASWKRVALRLGYTNFSEYVSAILNAMSERYDKEEWQSHLVFVDGTRIVGFGAPRPEQVGFATSAFQLLAPAPWWRHLERALEDADPEGSEPEGPAAG